MSGAALSAGRMSKDNRSQRYRANRLAQITWLLFVLPYYATHNPNIFKEYRIHDREEKSEEVQSRADERREQRGGKQSRADGRAEQMRRSEGV